MRSKFLKAAITTFITCLISIGSANAGLSTFQISMVADNDFALFSGDENGINNLLYQNNVDWYNQVPSISTFDFTLAAGDSKFYVLGMGGGGQENISGLVNGVNMTSVPVSMSANIAPFLSGYNASAVANGTYDANLLDVQTAFSNTSWSNAATNFNNTDIVINAAGFGSGYSFSHLNAHLFSFDAIDVGVEVNPVPAPSTMAIFALGMLGLASRRIKK
nr:hypothetical protein KPDKLGBK_00014 [uncultured bacterium]